jgi:hypothetical protein
MIGRMANNPDRNVAVMPPFQIENLCGDEEGFSGAADAAGSGVSDMGSPVDR